MEKKYKVCVYAICKNEEAFVNRWVDSMEEADAIYVLDTGSKDQTVEYLKNRKVHVKKKEIKPWRFDKARNISLEMVPEDTDICVCTDLDEVFEKGWRQKLEKIWNEKINRLQYNYNWSFTEDGKPAVNFYISKIHSRKDYTWKHPVHEALYNIHDNENGYVTDLITLNHYPDHTKPRSMYLPLLELSVKEEPFNDRNVHYLGREYMYYGRWNEAIDTLIYHLSLKSAVWKDERCASMRFIARSYRELGRYEEAKMWYQKAIEQAPYLREPYTELGILEYNHKNYEKAITHFLEALKIEKNPKSYINEPYCYDGTIEDYLSICLFYTGKKEESLTFALKAYLLKPFDQRIKKNIEIIKETLSN